VKIAYLLGSLNRGGTETLILDIAKNACKYGLNIICIHRKRGLLFDSFKRSGIELFELMPANRFDVFYLIRLRKVLRKQNIQIVHSHLLIDTMAALLATTGSKIKVVFTLHGHMVTHDRLSYLLFRIAFRKADRLIFVSRSQLTDYTSKFSRLDKNKCQVINNGIDFSKLDTPPANTLREELKIPENCLLLGSVGNFTSGRDQFTICRFLSLLKNKEIDFRFLFVGAKFEKEAWLYDRCISYCRDNDLSGKVIFTGTRNDIPAILQILDAFLYSTVNDTFGIAIIEAIATGIPVFANDTEVMKEITENGNLATLYRTNNENDLLEKFIHFNENKTTYRNKAAGSAVMVNEKYSIRNHINALKIDYHNLLN
jgi:L-malate glycosyltransferase